MTRRTPVTPRSQTTRSASTDRTEKDPDEKLTLSTVSAEPKIQDILAEGRRKSIAVTPEVPEELQVAMYKVPEAMTILRLSRSKIYQLIRSGRLRTVKEGRTRLIPATAIKEYVALLEREAGVA